MTPYQMRALANDANWRSQKLDHADDRRAIRKYEAALRTAADQLDAVWALLPWQNPELMDYGYSIDAAEVLAALTASKETTK